MGKKFDSSYDRGSPTTFAPNQVVSRRWLAAHTPLVSVLRGSVMTLHHLWVFAELGQFAAFWPQVIKGWTEAMQLMVEGDKWEMYIPSSLAYGDTKRGRCSRFAARLFFIGESLHSIERWRSLLQNDFVAHG
jgi:hypothetical protein